LEALTKYIVDKTRDHPIRVAIDGLDNAGKSKLAKELIFPLRKSGRQIINISIDGFHHPKKYRYRRGEYSPEGYYYDSFNLESVISNVLEPLSPDGNRQFRRQIFDYTTIKKLKANGKQLRKMQSYYLMDYFCNDRNSILFGIFVFLSISTRM